MKANCYQSDVSATEPIRFDGDKLTEWLPRVLKFENLNENPVLNIRWRFQN